MAFDRKHYRAIKAHTARQIRLRYWAVEETPENHVRHLRSFLPLIADCAAREDYESAKAVRDALIEYLNERLTDPLPADILLDLPDLKAIEIGAGWLS